MGIPAAVSFAIAFSLFSGCGARGSSVAAMRGSSDVTEIATDAIPFAAIGASRSMSRVTRSDLVVIVSGWSVSASTSIQARVMRQCASIG